MEGLAEKFLFIDEEPPEYKTKTGRTRVRKELIGRLQGAHDSMTGIVDIAMAGSLYKIGLSAFYLCSCSERGCNGEDASK